MNERCTVQHSTVLLEATVLYPEPPPPFLVVFPVVLYADSSPYISNYDNIMKLILQDKHHLRREWLT
jgi:hypothetical protein